MNDKMLPNPDMLSRLMADADRKMRDKKQRSERRFSPVASLLMANTFVVTGFASAIVGVALIGLF